MYIYISKLSDILLGYFPDYFSMDNHTSLSLSLTHTHTHTHTNTDMGLILSMMF